MKGPLMDSVHSNSFFRFSQPYERNIQVRLISLWSTSNVRESNFSVHECNNVKSAQNIPVLCRGEHQRPTSKYVFSTESLVEIFSMPTRQMHHDCNEWVACASGLTASMQQLVNRHFRDTAVGLS